MCHFGCDHAQKRPPALKNTNTFFPSRGRPQCALWMWSPTKKAHREILTSAAIKSCGHSAMENTSLRLKTILLYPAHTNLWQLEAGFSSTGPKD